MSQPPPIEGRVRDLTQAGDAVVEAPQGVLLVRGGLPGERLRLAPSKRRGRARRGRLLAVLEASDDRQQPLCPVAERCGGCPLMILDPRAQGALKRRLLQAALGSAAGRVEVDLVQGDATVGYRRRARLAFARGKLGYRAALSHTLVQAPGCLVLQPSLQEAMGALGAGVIPALAGAGEVWLALGDRSLPVARIDAREAQPSDAYAAGRALVEQGTLAGLELSVAGTTPARFGDCRACSIDSDGTALWGQVDGFAQANAEINAALVRTVVQLAQPSGSRLLELYAGHGNFTVALAQQAAQLTAVEAQPAAAAACRDNLRARGLSQVRVAGVEVEAFAPKGRVDCVVVDPPRAGLSPGVLDLLARLRPVRLVYVSCDMASLRRDLARLNDRGFGAEAATAFDMFPQTAHLEAVVLLKRSPGGAR